MSRLSYKTLFIILLFLLIPIVFLIRINQKRDTVSAAWWNETWRYRIAFTATNNSNFDAVNIPYRLTLDTATLIAAGKMQNSGDDIRIIDISTGEIIRFQVEQNTLNTTATGIWFDATIISKNSKQYYLYYGNSTATAETFTTDFSNVASDGSTVTSIDNYTYNTTNTSHPRVSYISKNGTDLGARGNMLWTSSYSGNWWDDMPFTRTLLASGPLFVEIKMEDTDYGNYSSYGSIAMVFKNGFVHTRTYMNYSVSTSEHLYYFLSLVSGTRNSLWINSSGTLIDQTENSPTLYESDLGANWFGQRWTDTGNYVGTIITKNGSDWRYGFTSAQSSYYQTNYSYTETHDSTNPRSVRYGLFTGSGSSAEMNEKASLLGLSSTSFNNSIEEISPAPVTYWKFDEGIGTTVYDSTQNNNFGTFATGTSAPIWASNEQCLSGNCLYFNGKNYVSVNHTDTNNFNTNDFTIQTWIKTSTIADNRNLLSKGAGAGYSGWRFGIRNGVPNMLIGDTLGFSEGDLGTTSLADNKWHLLSIVYNRSSNAEAFIDGKSVGTRDISTRTGSVNNSSGLYIGKPFASFTGHLDDIKLFPYARTLIQIKADYTTGLAGLSSSQDSSVNVGSVSSNSLSNGLVGYWKMDEGVGTSIVDSSGNNNQITFATGDSSPSWSSGKYGLGTSFGGNDYAISSINGTTFSDFTYSFWFNIDSTSGQYSLFSWGNTINDGSAAVIVRNNNGSLSIYNSGAYSSGTSVISGTWYNLTATYKNNQTLVYINGELKITFNRAMAAAYISHLTNLYFGTGYNGLAQAQIDEARIYNRALSPAEITQLYNFNPNPIGYFKFEDEGNTVQDSSGIGNTGLWSNSSSHYEIGKIGKSAIFTGSNNILVSSTSTYSTPYALTLSAWIKPNTSTGARMIISNLNSWDYRIYQNGLGLGMQVSLDDGNSGYHTATNVLTANQWQFVTGTFDGSTVKLYVNGQQVLNNTASGTIIDPNPSIRIGSNGGGSENFLGNIDEVKIYNYALSDTEILQEYNSTNPSPFSVTNLTVGNTSSSANYCPPGTTDYCASPIGEWKLDEGVGTSTVNTGNIGGTGTVANGTWATGKIGKAISFNGSSSTVDLASQTDLTSAGTVEFWFKYDSTKSTSTYERIISTYDDSSNEFRVLVNNTTPRQLYWIHKKDNITTPYIITNFDNNTWHHLTYTSNIGTSISKVYLDGVNISSTTTNVKPFNFSNRWYLGSSAGTNYWFPGLIDQVRLFNYARTPAQVAWDYNQGAPIAWWKMDECQGTTIHDSSTNQSHGTLNIGASGSQTSSGTCTTPNTAWGIGATGKFNSSLSFDSSDDYIQIPTITFSDSSPWTFSSWLKWTSSSSTTFYAGKNHAYEGFLVYYTNNFAFRDKNGVYYSYVPSNPFRNLFTHVTWVADGSGNLSLYLNGQFTKTTPSVPTQMNFEMIGRGYSTNGYNFGGQIDDVRIYNYALTSDQIKTVYNNGAINFN